MDAVTVAACGTTDAEVVHRLTQEAFAPHRALEPPSGAGQETVETVAAELHAGGGAIAQVRARPVGCLRWVVEPHGDLHVRRVAVAPALQCRGIGRALMDWADREARRRGCAGIAVGVRVVLSDNLAFYEALGYSVVGEERHDGYDHTTALTLRKPLAG